MQARTMMMWGGVHVAIAVAGLLAGCGTSQNTRTAIGEPRMSVSPGEPSLLRDRAVQLPGLAGDARKDAGLNQEKPGSTRLSLGTSLGREHWALTPILVPIDGVAGKPTYARWLEYTDETSRQRNEFPTAISALELDGDGDEQQLEMLMAGPRSLGGAALIPFRMVMHSPFKDVRHVPQPGYRAAPATRQASEIELERLRALDAPLSELTAPVSP